MKYTGFLLTALAAFGTQAQAQDMMSGNDKVKRVFFSEECGPADYNVANFGQGPSAEDGQMVMNEALEIGFMDLGVMTSEPGRKSVDCFVEVDVEVPAGKQFRAVGAYVEGTYSLGHKAKASAYIDYGVFTEGSERPFTFGVCDVKDIEGTFPGGDFQMNAPLEGKTFTECKNYPSIVTLRTTINASIFSKGFDLSEVVLDQRDVMAETKKAPKLAWDWDWMPCPPASAFEGGEFIASRGTSTGRLEDAHVTIQGNGGFFQTRSGQGELFDIQFFDKGYIAEGRWALGRDSGSFKFEITDDFGDEFKGTYTSDRTGITKQWKGYR